MDMAFLVKGIVLGLSIAAPVGPIGVLCIRRTLSEGRSSGLATGLGAATADALYGTVVALGLTFISSLLVDHGAWLRWFGGGLLCYLGVTTFMARPTFQSSVAVGQGVLRSYSTALLLTLTNPMTVFSFAAILAGSGAADAASGSWAPALLVLGTFLGSASWWLVLTSAVHLLRARLDERSLRWLNRVSGVVLVAFGLSSLASLL
jgi:threonine/homoserine/homoserine lactone efflux protein